MYFKELFSILLRLKKELRRWGEGREAVKEKNPIFPLRTIKKGELKSLIR